MGLLKGVPGWPGRTGTRGLLEVRRPPVVACLWASRQVADALQPAWDCLSDEQSWLLLVMARVQPVVRLHRVARECRGFEAGSVT